MSGKHKNTVSCAAQDDGWRTKWEAQLQQWELNRGDAPSIEAYIGAILGTKTRSEEELVSSKASIYRQWEAFTKAEPRYVKELRRFASSIRVAVGKDILDVPTEGAREVKVHRWLTAGRVMKESAQRKHGPHSVLKLRSSASMDDDEEEEEEEEEPRIKKRKLAATETEDAFPESIISISSDDESGDKTEPGKVIYKKQRGEKAVLTAVDDPDASGSMSSHDTSPCGRLSYAGSPESPNPGKNPQPEPAHEDGSNVLDPRENKLATFAELNEADGKFPVKKPISEWPEYNNVSKPVAKAFVDAILDEQSVIHKAGTRTTIIDELPWWILKQLRRGMTAQEERDMVRKILVDNPGPAREMAEGRWGKTLSLHKSEWNLEWHIAETLGFQHVIIPTRDVKWIIRMCQKHRGFSDRFARDLYPTRLFNNIPFDQCPYEQDSEGRGRWLQQELRDLADQDPILFGNWERHGIMSEMVPAEDVLEADNEMAERIREARRVAKENGWK